MSDLRIGRFSAVLAAVLASSEPTLAPAGAIAPPSCATSPELSVIEAPLRRTATQIDRGGPLAIVAVGSSSTQGVGATTPKLSYPSRLEQEMKDRFPGVEIRVTNQGIGGQDVGEELTRLDHDVIREHPDLVIWQVGTNAVLRRDDLGTDEQMFRRGVTLLKENAIDIVLMDLQYAPRVLARRSWWEMERLIAEVAHDAHVGLFRRFEIMQEWDHTQQLAPAALIGPDGLHMTDASYGCLANQLAEALAWNWWSHAKPAGSSHTSFKALARTERQWTAPSVGRSGQH